MSVQSQSGWRASIVPVLTVLGAIIVVWYIGAALLNLAWERDQSERAVAKGAEPAAFSQMLTNTMSQKRPVLPAPHQVAVELWKTTVDKKITSKRSLVYHAWVTLAPTLLGFVFGTLLGMSLAIGIVHNRAMDMSVMPWVIASQTIPIIATAPMIIIVLNAVGVSGLIPKAIIAMTLSFFPVTVGMVKGLRSPDAMQLDLMRTYNASGPATLRKLRLPSSLPYLFTSMKIAVAASLVGAIVAELPTGAVAGLGARLLAGSYYGQTVQIWSALLMASFVAAALVGIVGVLGRMVERRMGMAR
jgi:NitT/TauT family transport system permease protein